MTTSKPVIFYIDDEPFNLTVFEAALPDEWDVRTYQSPTEALQEVEVHKPWVIVSDQRMPGMSGVQFLEYTRKVAPRAIRMVVTGYADETLIIDTVRKAQIFDYIRKPWDANDLEARLRKAIDSFLLNQSEIRLLEDLKARHETVAAELTSKDELIRLIQDSTTDGIWDWNLVTGQEYYSPRWKSMLGYSEKELATKRNLWRDHIFSEDLPKALKACSDHLEHGTPLDVVLRYRHKNGGIVWVIFRGAAVKDAKGMNYRMVGTHTDITKLMAAEQAIAEQAKELERSNKELEQFAYIASHDLQEPLRKVASFCKLLQQNYKGKLSEEADRWIEYAVDGAIRLQRLVQDLLDYSRLEKQPDSMAVMNSEDALNLAIANLGLSLEESSAKITHDPLPEIVADTGQLTQVFQNLIGNGIKFKGPNAPHVHISAQTTTDGVVFSVRDNGIGIDPSYSEKVFAIFSRLHGKGAYPGTGIGLAVCKRIVEHHGGKIWVESTPGQGSTFKFTIPKRAAEQTRRENYALPKAS